MKNPATATISKFFTFHILNITKHSTITLHRIGVTKHILVFYREAINKYFQNIFFWGGALVVFDTVVMVGLTYAYTIYPSERGSGPINQNVSIFSPVYKKYSIVVINY